MEKLESILLSSFENLALRERISFDCLRRSWHTVCGEPLSLHTFPVDLRGGSLTVNVDSSPWLQQVRFLKKDLEEKLRDFQVKEIRFRLGRVAWKRQNEPGRKEVARGLSDEELSDADREWLQATLLSVRDEDLRDLLRRTIARTIPKGPRGPG
ncbi:MAG: DUF721 domain-containing protein [Chloroflexota bacterium]